MYINDIFEKDIQRPIEGVIKADDTAQLGTEVEEYVLTNEAAKGLTTMLEAYTDYTHSNGVWISGFYGSGKSHMLKMLAYLLGDVEGQDFSRERVSQSFRDKTSDDAFLQALITKADGIPAKNLLFNIDQKAPRSGENQDDVLLRTFAKVFNDSCGYYGDQGHIARFERHLDEDGQLDAFRAAFQEVSKGRAWEDRRSKFTLPTVQNQVNQAYAAVTGAELTENTNILEQYERTYSMSIEDFADDVKAWLDAQGDGARLNFFVDEVGQFIGSNTHLMLNLQTIAESLNTKCAGLAWIFVTSQEDMDKIIGDRTKAQGNDFSKIQARFSTRLKLTSGDVEEVIRKRLLEKNTQGTDALETLYGQEAPNFKTLFSFADGSKTYRTYVDDEHFVNTYPFVPYQFPMLQAAIESLSHHNMFEGRNTSVGARSLLGVVKEVAKGLTDVEVGGLASFDHMFREIRKTVKDAAQRSILVAEKNLDNELAVRLLKALFLVKYVDGFNATPRNLTVLVYDEFGIDLPKLTQDVQDALLLLEAETYVQRKGDEYEYLTNEEQVMENEIKNVDIDSAAVASRLHRIISGDVIKTTKIRYDKSGQDFSFGYLLDDVSYGRTHDLNLHFITEESGYTPTEIRMQSAGRDELRVVLPRDERLLPDLRLLLKTEKYIKQKQTTSLSLTQSQILQAKAAQNDDRAKELIARISNAVGKAELITNATNVTSSSQDAFTRVTDGFQRLISRTYTQLGLLGGHTFSEQDITTYLNPDQTTLLDGAGMSTMTVPGEEVRSHVLLRDGKGYQVTVKTIVEHFQARPYGWDLTAIQVILAWLVGESHIAFKLDGNTLKRSEVASLLRNTAKHGNLVVSPQKDFDQRKVTAFRDFCMEFLDDPSIPRDPNELAHDGAQKLSAKHSELTALTKGAQYPFIASLEEAVDLLGQVINKPEDWYLTEFDAHDALLDVKSDVIDRIVFFLKGTQRDIYDTAKELLNDHRGNLDYISSDSADVIRRTLNDPNVFRGKKMAHLKATAETLRNDIEDALAIHRGEAIEKITSRWQTLQEDPLYRDATDTGQTTVNKRVQEQIDRISEETQITIIRTIASAFEQKTYPELFNYLQTVQRPVDPTPTADDDSEETPPPTSESKPAKQTVSIKTVEVTSKQRLLATEKDVEVYLNDVRRALLDALNHNKQITL